MGIELPISNALTGFIQASLSKIQGLPRLSYSFQGLKVYENPDLSVKVLLQRC